MDIKNAVYSYENILSLINSAYENFSRFNSSNYPQLFSFSLDIWDIKVTSYILLNAMPLYVHTNNSTEWYIIWNIFYISL